MDDANFRSGFEPLLPGCTQIPFNDLAALEQAQLEQLEVLLQRWRDALRLGHGRRQQDVTRIARQPRDVVFHE